MKKRQLSGWLLVASGCLMLASCAASQISKAEKNRLSAMIQAGHFIFKAQKAMAQNGYSRVLTSDYTLTVLKDSINTWLPYFGRAYRAPMDPSEGGIHFSSTDFSYHMTERRKSGWQVEIIPHDHKDQVDKMQLTITPSGYGTLQVISTHRSPITFYGKVKAEK